MMIGMDDGWRRKIKYQNAKWQIKIQKWENDRGKMRR